MAKKKVGGPSQPNKKRIPEEKRYSSDGLNKKRIPEEKRYSSDGLTLVWCFDRVDRTGKFAFDPSRTDFDHREIIDKLISYGSMSWSDLKRQTHDKGKSKHHFLKIETLSPEAIDRVRTLLPEEEFDSVFSIALQNVLRVIGVRKDEKFFVMWYDAKHEFCPSHRK